MSSDLFAAFGEAPAGPPMKQQVNSHTEDPWDFGVSANQVPDTVLAQDISTQATTEGELEDDDDFGDFEDASAATIPADITKESRDLATNAVAGDVASGSLATNFPPKAQTRAKESPPEQVVGRHPFADHMDLLFSGGDDEYDAGADDLDDLSKNPEAAVEYSKRMIAEQEAQFKTKPLPFSRPGIPVTNETNPPRAPNKLQKKSGYAPAKDPNVLFDVENVSEHDTDGDDDFGDFEDAPVAASKHASTPVTKMSHTKLQKKSGPPPPKAQATPAKPRMPQIDLLGLGDEVSVPNIMSPRSERATNILGHAKADSMSRPKTSSLMPKQEDDAWDDFDTAEPQERIIGTNSSKHTTCCEHGPHQAGNPPPTNVPPPVILLSAFSSIFSSAQDALLIPLSKLDLSQRSHLLSHPATHQFLSSYLKSAIVLAHIIAGRKLRWKRDQILAQSMRIGPSAAGGKGGMKLTSIDKSEIGKEDREVLDTVQRWKAQVGKLRSAVTAASGTPQAGKEKMPNVPDIAETMPVRTLKATEGGFVAPHACALCGLKREERVVKVDVDVNDSFGEWWVDGSSMHIFCQEWWIENKGKLKGR
ncbi:hypothetical protein Slin15195_G003130 [Septoria linicola]|uniref:Uncharacterized protein n=1 Tax=Septoria linicola TaxID=215465 RepID=A0A9Q9EEJ8_9PEZI|nr:hypothetical protein Slin15195_G003130 [Septoria linicola]